MSHRLKFCAIVFTSLFAIASVSDAGEAKGDALDQQVYWILYNKCTKCHDDLENDAASGIDDLLDLQSLYAGYLDPSDEEMLNDLVLGADARMPKPQFDAIKWNGPLTDAEKQTVRDWLNRGGPSSAYAPEAEAAKRDVISIASMLSSIAKDLQTLSSKELENARYLTLSNLHNRSDVTEQELELYRTAIVKTLNSLSQSSDVLGLDTSSAPNKLIAVDEARTIFRFDLRDIEWTNKQWDLLARFYPFATKTNDGVATSVYTMTTSSLPYLRADWFVFASLQPPLYHELVGIPPTLAELEHALGIDRLTQIRNLKVARSGMIESKVSDYNRLLERISFRGGAYHLSYDNGSNEGESNFLEFPLGPKGLGLANGFEFKHDGGEAIFNLPNGYQAYVLVDGEGNRLDIAPSAIVQDGTMPREAIINGISCLSCHFQGMKPEKYSPRLSKLDDVRDAVKENYVRFTADERQLVTELYPTHEEFEELLERDRQRYLEALEKSGIPQRGATEPARELFNRFKNDLDVASLAAEFGMSEEEFRVKMSRETETRQLLKVAEQGVFDRQRLLAQYARIARLVGLGNVEASEQLPFPYFAEDTSKFALNTAAQNGGNPTVGHTGIDLIDAENRNGQLQVELWAADQRRSFQLGELLQLRVRANLDGFLTLISVDSAGDITLLVPNKFHGEFRVRRNETVTIPTPQMNFEFVAQRPTGPTIIKAIVTARPLPLKDISSQRLSAEGMPSLGRAKGFGVRQKPAETPTPTNSQPAFTSSLTTQSLGQLYAPNEWGTASITLNVRE